MGGIPHKKRPRECLPPMRALNSLKHGLRSAQVLLPGEDEAEFAKLSKRFRAELRPKGPLESAFVERAVGQLWRLRRATRIEAEVLLVRALDHVFDTAHRRAREFEIHQTPRRAAQAINQEDHDEELLKEEQAERQRDEAVLGHAFSKATNAIGTLTRYETAIERSLHRNLEQLKRLQEARRKAAR